MYSSIFSIKNINSIVRESLYNRVKRFFVRFRIVLVDSRFNRPLTSDNRELYGINLDSWVRSVGDSKRGKNAPGGRFLDLFSRPGITLGRCVKKSYIFLQISFAFF